MLGDLEISVFVWFRHDTICVRVAVVLTAELFVQPSGGMFLDFDCLASLGG